MGLLMASTKYLITAATTVNAIVFVVCLGTIVAGNSEDDRALFTLAKLTIFLH